MNRALNKALYWRITAYFVVGFVVLVLTLPPKTLDHLLKTAHSTILKMQGGDLLDRRMKAKVPNGVDCGRSRPHTNVTLPTECALNAFNAKKPFRVREDVQGIDSDIAIGVVGTADGAVVAMFFNGDPFGGGGTSLLRQQVVEQPCPAPVQLFKSPSGRLNCFPPDPTGKRNIMSF